MSALDLLESRLASNQPITIDDLGGVDEILADADRLYAAPFLDILAYMISAAPPMEGARLHDFLVDGFDAARDPQSFRDAIDQLIRSATLRAAMAQAVVAIFTRRIREHATEREALIAAYSLEGLFRLALEGDVKPSPAPARTRRSRTRCARPLRPACREDWRSCLPCMGR